MRNASYGHVAVLAHMAAIAVFGVGGCAQDEVAEELHVRYHHHDILGDGTIIDSASGCITLDLNEAGEVLFDDPFLEDGGSSDFSVKRELTHCGLRVTGISKDAGNQILMEKLFSPDFIRSGFTDIADIQAPDRHYQVAHRGVLSCKDSSFELFPK